MRPFSSPDEIRMADQNFSGISPDFNVHEAPPTGGKYCSTASVIRDVAGLAFLVIGIASGVGALAGAVRGALSISEAEQ